MVEWCRFCIFRPSVNYASIGRNERRGIQSNGESTGAANFTPRAVASERDGKHKVCNCRVETRCHNPDCLDAILKGASWSCPLHGFRELGFFIWTSRQHPLNSQDNQFCLCPPYPWRSFLLSERPHTWEGHDAAKEASNNYPRGDYSNVQENNLRFNAMVEHYLEEREQWVEKTGRQLAQKEEIVKMHWERAGDKAGKDHDHRCKAKTRNGQTLSRRGHRGRPMLFSRQPKQGFRTRSDRRKQEEASRCRGQHGANPHLGHGDGGAGYRGALDRRRIFGAAPTSSRGWSFAAPEFAVAHDPDGGLRPPTR